MASNNLIGVILAAGKGARMEPFSTRYPKPILPICNKPVLQYQIEHMKKLGINEVIIVIGYLGFEIVEALGNGKNLDVQIRYVEQKETLGIAHALGKLEPYITCPFLLFLGDIFFITERVSSMIHEVYDEKTGAVLAVKEEEDREAIKRNFAVLLDENRLVKRVIEKPRHTPNKLKGCGLYLFDLSFFDAIRRTPRTAMRDEYEITDAIQIFIDDGAVVKVAPVVKWDINLTYPYDLLRCNLKQLQISEQMDIIGQNCQIPPGTKILNSVIGDNVIVNHSIEIIDSVIFPNSVVSSRVNIEKAIITPENIIDCRYLQGKEETRDL